MIPTFLSALDELGQTERRKRFDLLLRIMTRDQRTINENFSAKVMSKKRDHSAIIFIENSSEEGS